MSHDYFWAILAFIVFYGGMLWVFALMFILLFKIYKASK